MTVKLSLNKPTYIVKYLSKLKEEGREALLEVSRPSFHYNSIPTQAFVDLASLSLFERGLTNKLGDTKGVSGSFSDSLTIESFGMKFSTLIGYTKILHILLTFPTLSNNHPRYLREIEVIKNILIVDDLEVSQTTDETNCFDTSMYQDNTDETTTFIHKLFGDHVTYIITKQHIKDIVDSGLMCLDNTAYDHNETYRRLIDQYTEDNNVCFRFIVGKTRNKYDASNSYRHYDKISGICKGYGLGKLLDYYKERYSINTNNPLLTECLRTSLVIKGVLFLSPSNDMVLDATDVDSDYYNNVIKKFNGADKDLINLVTNNTSFNIKIFVNKKEYNTKRKELSLICKQKGTKLKVCNNISTNDPNGPIEVVLHLNKNGDVEQFYRSLEYISNISNNFCLTTDNRYNIFRYGKYIEKLKKNHDTGNFTTIYPVSYGLPRNKLDEYFYVNNRGYIFKHTKILNLLKEKFSIDKEYIYALIEDGIYSEGVNVRMSTNDLSKIAILKLKGARVKNIVVRPCDLDAAIELLSYR